MSKSGWAGRVNSENQKIKEVFKMHYQQMTPAKIGMALNISPATVIGILNNQELVSKHPFPVENKYPEHMEIPLGKPQVCVLGGNIEINTTNIYHKSKPNNKCYYPVDSKGNMMETEGIGITGWEKIESFRRCMSFRHFSGSKARRPVFSCSKGFNWSLAEESLEIILKHSVKGLIDGEWIVIKRGTHYALKLIEVK